MGVDFDQQSRIPTSTLQELRGILMSSLSRENLGMLDQPEPRRRKVHFQDNAGAAPVEANNRQSRPSSIKGGAGLDITDELGLEELSPTGEQGSRDAAAGAASQDREERARLARERQNSERARKLEELRAQALSAQRFREQKEEERRKRIDEMRSRDNDRRHQVEERKRAIWEAERERREAIVRRNEEREARLEGRRRGAGAAGVFAFGSSTPRMLEPADTGGSFWGHRRATSTSNVMFAALPLSRRSSERELDPNKKRATSASGLDRQGADDYRVSTTMYDVFHWDEFGASEGTTNSRQIFPVQMGHKEEAGGDGAPWSRVARRRTDLVPTVTGSRGEARAPRSPGSGLRSGEVTPGSPSRPGSSLSSASTAAGSSSATMTSSVMGSLVNRRPRVTPRRPRPASIAGTGVTTPPHVKTTTVGADGKIIGVRAEKPPLPRVHSAGTSKKGPQPPTPTQDKPEVPKRAHKGGSVKASPRLTPRSTPLQSPASDLPPSVLQDVQESVLIEQEDVKENTLVSESQSTETINTESDVSNSTITETVQQVTKEVNGEESKVTTVTTTISSNGEGDSAQSVTETVVITEEISASVPETKEDSTPPQKVITEMVKNLKIKEEVVEKPQEMTQSSDPLEGADMTASMSARGRGVITTEGEAKAALAERRRLAREEAERAAERERLRLEKEEEEEAERQRQEEEKQRQLEEETMRLSELQRQSEEERLQQAILEAQRRTEEEAARREQEVRARAEREAAEARAREVAERLRRETEERLRREEEEREARRKRVEAIMLRTRQAKQKKDGDKSPTEENKSLEESDQKFIENKMATEEVSQQESVPADQQQRDSESAYELSVREREEALLSHSAPHNQAQTPSPTAGNGITSFRNGSTAPTNGGPAPDVPPHNYGAQNGHSKSQMNELNNFINTSENQYNNVALDNAVTQNNVTNLLDISEVDLLNTANKNNPFLIDINTNGGSLMQPLTSPLHEGNNTLTGDTISKNFVNEDSMNSNQTTNSPFITSFQDNQENRDVSLL